VCASTTPLYGHHLKPYIQLLLLVKTPLAYLKRALLGMVEVVRLTKAITVSYVSEKLKKGIVLRAPSTFHAAYLETLIAVFRLGATPEMLKLFTASYERLNTQVSRIRSFSRTLEATMAGLVAVVGGFLTYVDRVFTSILGLIWEVAGAGFPTPLNNPLHIRPKDVPATR